MYRYIPLGDKRAKMNTIVLQICVIISMVCKFTIANYTEYHDTHMSKQLSLTNNSQDNLLLPFNTTRVPGSPESLEIQNLIINHYKTQMKQNWTIELDNFQEKGYNYTNMIFTLDPMESGKYVVFAAHYDTLVNIEGFIGAVDSAASCSILLYLSHFLDTVSFDDINLLDKKWNNNELGIKIIFFDGEEAIHEWTETDSIYGSRHLANKWTETDEISQIELFILLDLIGGKRTKTVPNWKIKSYYKSSHKYYQELSHSEDKYLIENIDNTETVIQEKELFPTDVIYLMLNKILIEDDHVPFYNADVSILHLIPFPFPETWHTINDTFDTLDINEIHRWTSILCDFALKLLSNE